MEIIRKYSSLLLDLSQELLWKRVHAPEGVEPALVEQRFMGVVGKNNELEIHVALAQQLNQSGRLLERDVSVIIAVYQKHRRFPFVDRGASAIKCCYAAIERCESSSLTNKAESKNTAVTFCSTRKCNVEEKISLNVSRLEVKPACMAGVLTSRPNFSAL